MDHPAMHFGRRALSDTVIGTVKIAAGEIVTLWNAAGNMDSQVFIDPTGFDLARRPNKHLAFGYGSHFCLGAFLGRALVGSILRALRDLVSTIEVTTPPRRLHSNHVHGYTSAPMRLLGG